MKIAFDENLPPALVKVFQTLADEGGALRSQIVSARDYSPPSAKSDVPWIERFASDGGKIIISGDVKMRGKLVERKALSDHGLITIFFHRRWGRMDLYSKSAMLLKWWPVILRTIHRAKPGQFFEVPMKWEGDKLENVSPPGGTRKKPGPRKKSERLTEQQPQRNPIT